MDKFDEILASVAKPVNGSCWILTYDKLDELEGPDIAVSTVNYKLNNWTSVYQFAHWGYSHASEVRDFLYFKCKVLMNILYNKRYINFIIIIIIIPNKRNPGYPINGNRWSENQSINRYKSIKLVNWYRLVSVNQWSMENHTKTVHWLVSIGTATLNKRHTCYLFDHRPFLGGPGDKIGKTIPTQSFKRKEYTPLHLYSNYPVAHHCFSVSLCLHKTFGKRLYWIYGASSKAIIFAVLRWRPVKCYLLTRREEGRKTQKRV